MLNNHGRTPSNKQRLKLKSTHRRKLIPLFIVNMFKKIDVLGEYLQDNGFKELPYNYCKWRKGSNLGHQYILIDIRYEYEEAYIFSHKGFVRSFSKPQPLRKIITIGKKRFRIISKY